MLKRIIDDLRSAARELEARAKRDARARAGPEADGEQRESRPSARAAPVFHGPGEPDPAAVPAARTQRQARAARPAPPRAAPRLRRRSLAERLRDPATLREAFVVKELLDAPVALRRRGRGRRP